MQAWAGVRVANVVWHEQVARHCGLGGLDVPGGVAVPMPTQYTQGVAVVCTDTRGTRGPRHVCFHSVT
jgi:hypothetical protein